MKLNRLSLTNFRNFSSQELEFGDVNYLSGKNGSGKSSIKEAVLFALYGKDLNGSNLGLRELVKQGENSAKVSAEFSDYTVQRLRSLASSKVFFFDGSTDQGEVAQRDLESILPEAKLFQCIFDVGFFFGLPLNEQRQLIIDNSPVVNRLELFTQLWGSDPKDFLEKYGVNLNGNLGAERKKLQAERLRIEKNQYAKTTNIRALEDEIKELEVVVGASDIEATALGEQLKARKVKTCDKCGQPTPDFKTDELKRIYSEAVGELRAYNQTLIEKKAVVGALRKSQDTSGDDMSLLEDAIKYLAPNMVPARELEVKVRPMVAFLKKIIPEIDIKLMREVQTTLEWVETFEVTVKGVTYDRLSTGEKLRVGLAFSMLIDKLSGGAVNMFFLDNYESVTWELPKVVGQFFLARVVDKQELKLEVSNEK